MTKAESFGDVLGDPAHHLEFMRARIIMRGTDPSDYERVRDNVRDWKSWWSSWIELAQRHLQAAERYQARGWAQSEGNARVRAGLAYHWGKSLAVEDDDRYREVTQLSVDAVVGGQQVQDETFERIEIPFETAKLVGNLRRPRGSGRPPLVVLVPGLESVKEEFPTWEDHFLERGLATFSLDGPGQGESGYDLRQRHDYEVPFGAALDALESRDDLDLARVGAAGVSLGGYHVVRAAAFEPRIKAILSNCGPWNFGEAYDRLEPLQQAKMWWNLGATNHDDARSAAARFDLDGIAQQVEQPTLVIFGDADVLIDATHGTRLADALPHGELWMVKGGNHGVTNYPYEHLGPGADWLRQQLLTMDL
jgi:2,6-dihydroxypseudooxynicotine hydrolase